MYDIQPRKKPKKPRTFGEAWWDGVSMSPKEAALRKCYICKEDTDRFWKLVGRNIDVSKFEIRDSKDPNRMHCVTDCQWYEWFLRQRTIK